MNRQNVDTLLAENERLKADLAALQQKYDLVSELLEAKPSKNEAFEAFKKVFNEDFMAFANKESSLADEATAVQRLQALEKRLEQFVAFPHTFVKRSIAIGGGFSSGKSAFVNSFIAQSGIELPVGITPVTAIPSYVMASKDVSIKGCARTGATVDVPPNLYEQLSHDSQSSRDSMVAFRHLMPAIAVEVPLQAGFEHICLVDTPGYDAAGGQTSGDETTAAEALKNQDAALIWMISAESGTVPSADLDFIQGLELNGRPFYVVLTKADLKPPSELEDIRAVVKKTLEDEELKPVGISAYCSRTEERGRKYPSDGLSLHDFFRRHNQPVENLGAELKAELESVFSMYEKAIGQDEKSAKLLMKRLKSLDLDLNEEINEWMDEDVAEVFSKKIDKIKQSQDRDFAPIKQELGRVKKAMFAAVKQVLLSLVEEDPKSVAELNAVWQQGRAKRRSQSTRRQPADVQGKDAPNRYTLHQVAKINDYKKAAALLAKGAHPNAKDQEGYAPLHWAAEHNAHQTVKVLLDYRARVNSRDKKDRTPLHYAAWEDAHQTVKVLLAKGADPNTWDREGRTPLHYAAWENAYQTVEMLLAYRRTSTRARVNSRDNKGRTPLHYAAEYNAHQTVKVLLAKGADPNTWDREGRTPLYYANKNNAHKTARLLQL